MLRASVRVRWLQPSANLTCLALPVGTCRRGAPRVHITPDDMAQRLRKLGIEGLSCKGGPCTSVGLTSAGLTCDEHGTAVRNGTATGMAPLVDERRWWRLLTVVIVTSPVPSNPDTSVLRAVFAAYSRVEGLLRARKVIHFDGPQPRLPPERKSAYEEFKRRVLVLAGEHPDFAHLQCYSAYRFLFAAHNLAAAVAQARARAQPGHPDP